MSTHQDSTRKPGKSLRHSGVLNIAELSQRGGLPSNLTPYTMGVDEQGGHIRLFGNATPTVNECVVTGLGMEAAGAGYYVSIRPGCTAQTIATKYPNVCAFFSEREIQEKIIARSSLQSDSELAQEIYDRHEKQNLILQNWKPHRRESQAARAHRRQKAINPLLHKLGLSRGSWAQQAGLNWHTVRNFMEGKTASLTSDTRKRLAGVLGLEPKDFPA